MGDLGVRIKLTAKERRKVNRCIEERACKGKESIVVLDGVVQSKQKTDRELARTQYREYRGMQRSKDSLFPH
jgi:DNA polymerase IIIc chi subunit